MTVEEIEAGRDGMRELLAQEADDATELSELGNVVAAYPDRCTGCGKPVSELEMRCPQCEASLPWPPQADIDQYNTDAIRCPSNVPGCGVPYTLDPSMRAICNDCQQNLTDKIRVAASRIIDAVAELGTPGQDCPEFVEINETSVYRIEREPGFPTADEVACVRMFKLVGDGREFNAGDGIEAYSVVQNRDGTYSCDCASYVFRLSKIADQRSEAARCKHARKLIQIGVFK